MNVTVTEVLFQPAAFGVGTTVAVIVGGVVSIETVADADAELPATSSTARETARSAPSVDTTTGSGQPATPEPASVHVNVIVTGALYQPPESGARSTAAVMTGGVESTL